MANLQLVKRLIKTKKIRSTINRRNFTISYERLYIKFYNLPTVLRLTSKILKSINFKNLQQNKKYLLNA